jgi:hypothetical protein
MLSAAPLLRFQHGAARQARRKAFRSALRLLKNEDQREDAFRDRNGDESRDASVGTSPPRQAEAIRRHRNMLLKRLEPEGY